MSKKVLVIGATGRVGSELVKLLSGHGAEVKAAARKPLQAQSKFPHSVECVEFDYDKPETFAPAVAGVGKIFLSVRPGDNHSDKAAIPLIDEAVKVNVKQIVALTAMGVEQDETFMLRILENYIEASGIPFTHLRPNWFMQNFDSGPMYAEIKATGALHLPAADAKISFIDARDISAVGFRILSEPNHAGKAYTLTGKEPLSYFEALEKISLAAGKKIDYVPISEDIARESLVKAGVQNDLIERWADFHNKVRQGLCAPVTPDVENILGREPIFFDQYANDYAGSWR